MKIKKFLRGLGISVLFFVVFFVGLNAGTLVVAIVGTALFGEEALATATTIGQCAGGIVAALLMLLVYKLTKKSAIPPLEINPVKPATAVIAVVVGMLCSFLTQSGLALLPVPAEVKQQMVEQQLESVSLLIAAPPILLILAIAIFAPIAEEIAFRGGMLQAMRRDSNAWISVIVSALMFGLMHFAGGLRQIGYTFVLGLILALVCHVTKSILPAIIVHILNNGWLFLLPEEAALNVEAFWTGSYAWAVFLGSAVLIAGCVYLMSRLEKGREWKVLNGGKVQ